MQRPGAVIATLRPVLIALGLLGAFGRLPHVTRARYRDSIAFKLHAVLGLAVGAVLALTAVSVLFAARTQQATSLLMADGISTNVTATRLELLLQQHRGMVESAPAQSGRDRLWTLDRALRAINSDIVAVSAQLREMGPDSVTRLGTELGRDLPALFNEADVVLGYAVRSSQEMALQAAQGRYAVLAAQLQQRISAWRQERAAILQRQTASLALSAHGLISRVVGCAALVLGLGMVAALLSRRLLRRLDQIKTAMLRVAADDLDVEIPLLRSSDEIGAMARAADMFRQNTMRVAAQDAALQEAARRFETALANMSQGLCLYDADSRLQVVNRRFSELFGIEHDRVEAGLSYRDVVQLSIDAGNHAGQTADEIVASREVDRRRAMPETVVLRVTDERWIAICHSTMDGGGWVATYEDVTARHLAEHRIAYMARHDALTGLPNRTVLTERLEQAVAEAGRGIHSAVLCLDLDRFKAINDTLGHPVGDALLRAVSDRLRALVREVDMVVRLGGDEFAIVQGAITRPEDATRLAERIIASVSAPFEVEGHQAIVGVSVGISLVPEDGAHPATLLRNADMAMYRAKTDGKGRFCCFEPDMDARLQNRRRMEIDLRTALALQQFELFYQPLVDLTRGEVSGFEALLRWRHPDRGLVSPAEFIPIIEDIGLIVPVGEWVIDRACADAAGWPSDVRVAVNLSPAQFQGQRLTQSVARALSTSGLAPRRLELEITESVLLQDDEATMATLHGLRALGVKIAMDDFGTGYSSLSYLRSFPFDKVKIDQSFIRDLSDRAESVHVVRAVTGLCAGLGMSTTAEGVETREQLATLRIEGCTEVQGFLFSRPKPAADVPAIIESVREFVQATGARPAPGAPALRIVAG